MLPVAVVLLTVTAPALPPDPPDPPMPWVTEAMKPALPVIVDPPLPPPPPTAWAMIPTDRAPEVEMVPPWFSAITVEATLLVRSHPPLPPDPPVPPRPIEAEKLETAPASAAPPDPPPPPMDCTNSPGESDPAVVTLTPFVAP